MLIRRAKAGDAQAIEQLYRLLLAHPAILVTAHRVEQAERSIDTALLVAEQRDAIVGSLLLCFCMDVMFAFQPFAVIENLIVDPAWRGRGMGEELLSEAENIARSRRCSKLMLLSSMGRQDAHRLFESAGFQGDTKRGFVKYSRDLGHRP